MPGWVFLVNRHCLCADEVSQQVPTVAPKRVLCQQVFLPTRAPLTLPHSHHLHGAVLFSSLHFCCALELRVFAARGSLLAEGRKSFGRTQLIAHVSGPNCFGNVSRRIRKKKSSPQGPYFFVSLTSFEVTRICKMSQAPMKGQSASKGRLHRLSLCGKLLKLLFQNTSATHKSSLPAIVVGRFFFPSMHSRDVTCARLANATAPASFSCNETTRTDLTNPHDARHAVRLRFSLPFRLRGRP